MLKSLLVPTSFVTLLGIAPPSLAASLAAEPAPDPTGPRSAAEAPPAAPPLAEAPPVSTPAALVVVGSPRVGNARAPSYGPSMVRMKAEDPDGGLIVATRARAVRPAGRTPAEAGAGATAADPAGP